MKDNTPEAIKHVAHVADLWLPLKIQYDRMPGVSVGIVYKGTLIYKKGFGFSDIDKKKRTTETTRYHIASHSKMFTATGIMQLVEQGKLRLDDKVADYIEWFKAKNGHADTAHVTIRQLLSHASGIFRDGDTGHWETGKFPKDLKSSFSPKAARFESLASFKYSNYGFSVLGEIIARVSSLSYEEYMKRNILRPLGMNSTVPDYEKGMANVAIGYGRNIPGQKERRRFAPYATHIYAPATGFVSNVVDLAKFIHVFSLDNTRGVLSRESKKEMMHTVEKTLEGDEYGLGIEITYIKGRKIVGHGGGFSGYITKTMWDPKIDLGVIVLSNSLDSSASGIAEGIFETIYGFLETREDYMRGKKIQYSKYEGIYRNIWGDALISRFGNALIEFSPRINSPLKWNSILLPEKTMHHFLIKSKNVFGDVNESAEFGSFKNGKAQKFFISGTPLKRVS